MSIATDTDRLPADPHCHDCEGTGYVRRDLFDPSEGEHADQVEVCACVLQARGHAE
ncbi:MAG: hypothetical protein KGL39_28065 [Patescibacteria group bacterium]|nr:hypothetical protein [Patescibacteria group bacterium]